MTDIYQHLAEKIIKEQAQIIGPLARIEANKVNGLKVESKDVIISGDGKAVLESLINQYATLFGQTSIEVCKEAVKNQLGKLQEDQIPQNLR